MNKFWVLYEIIEGYMTVEMEGENIQEVTAKIEDGEDSLSCECEQDGVKYDIRKYKAVNVGNFRR